MTFLSTENFFSMSMDLIRCAGRGHLTVDVLWKKFEIWMGQLKVKVIHASVTQKCWAECNKTMRRFGLDCVKLSGLSAWVAWQLNTIQTKSTHDLAHLAQHFVSDGACFTLTFNCPIQISKFFHKTSTVRCPLPANLIKSVDIEKNSQSTKTSYGSSRGQTNILFYEMRYWGLFKIFKYFEGAFRLLEAFKQ